MLLNKAKETIRRHSMLSSGDRVVVAVSGGPDSVCLLSVLHMLAEEYGISLHVAHLDHRFRGAESAAEAMFVDSLAKKLGIPCTISAFDVPAYCRERGLSSQEGARAVRYGFLQQVAHDAEASHIATGHTANDQAETFLMRLMRGAGMAGLSAIPPVRDNIIRPLIDATREDVLAHLRENGLEYKTDPSNARPEYTRNRVRMELMPVLHSFNPRIVETLAAEAALLRDENEAVKSYLGAIVENASVQLDDTLSVKREVFDSLPQAFRRRLLRKLVDRAGGDPATLSMGQIDDALSFMLSAQTGRSVDLPHRLTVSREYDRFIFSTPVAHGAFSHTLAVPGTTVVQELGFMVEASAGNAPPEAREDINYLWQALFDYDKISPLLTVRTRRPGDRFCPAGMGGKSKKLQDYFVDEKVPRRKRDMLPLLCAGEDILWIMGLRTDERFLPGPGTKNVLTVQVSRTQESEKR